jgi:putative transposase
MRSDNGPEFVATAVLRWLTDEGIETAHITPGKPWQNGTDENFNGRFVTSASTWSTSGAAPKPSQ